jgi:hypothetical protein
MATIAGSEEIPPFDGFAGLRACNGISDDPAQVMNVSDFVALSPKKLQSQG